MKTVDNPFPETPLAAKPKKLNKCFAIGGAILAAFGIGAGTAAIAGAHSNSDGQAALAPVTAEPFPSDAVSAAPTSIPEGSTSVEITSPATAETVAENPNDITLSAEKYQTGEQLVDGFNEGLQTWLNAGATPENAIQMLHQNDSLDVAARKVADANTEEYAKQLFGPNWKSNTAIAARVEAITQNNAAVLTLYAATANNENTGTNIFLSGDARDKQPYHATMGASSVTETPQSTATVKDEFYSWTQGSNEAQNRAAELMPSLNSTGSADITFTKVGDHSVVTNWGAAN